MLLTGYWKKRYSCFKIVLRKVSRTGSGETMDSNEKTLDNSLESTINMSQDEIERLLLQSSEQGQAEEVVLDSDLESLLASMEATGGDELQDISDMLAKADQNEAVSDDVLALLKSQEENEQTAYEAMDLFSGESESKKEGFFSRLRKKSKKKEDKPLVQKEKKVKKEKKPKKEKSKNAKEENNQDWEKLESPDSYSDSSTNNSMDDALSLLMGTEANDVANIAEKPVKEKKKKSKSNKKASPVSEEEEIKEKPKKKEKEKVKKEKPKEKNKKEKPEKKNKKERTEIREKSKERPTIQDAIMELEAEQEEPPNKKKIIMTFMASILIMLGFLVVNYHFTGHANKRLAQEAYEKKDYLECYQLLYGQRMNDSQKAMFKRSECILKTEIFWRNYNTYVQEEKWLEGLDELTQYVHGYSKALEDALTWNGQDIVENTYKQVESILLQEYGTDCDEISNIATLESDVDYTRALLNIIEEKEN